MTAAWVAASARGRLLARRRLGGTARRVAAAADADGAVAIVAASTYRRGVHVGMSREAASRAVGAVCLWNLRVLAGWVPPRGEDVVRVFAGRFELVNVADRVLALSGHAAPKPYALGALSTVWPRVATAATIEDVRAALAHSPWGDPGSTDWPAMAVALEARWALWLAEAVPGAAAWGAGRAGLVAAGEVQKGRAVPAAVRRDLGRLLGTRWEHATDLAALRAGLPVDAGWVIDGLDGSDLWRAEGRWWQRVDREAAATSRAGGEGPAVVGAAAASLVADAWRAQAALQATGWGPLGLEVFDAVA